MKQSTSNCIYISKHILHASLIGQTVDSLSETGLGSDVEMAIKVIGVVQII